MYTLFVQALGFVAMAFCIGSYQIKSSRGLILCKTAGDTLYVIHYLMLGAYSGCATMVFCALSGFLCSFKGSRRWADWSGWGPVFAALMVLAGASTVRSMADVVLALFTVVSMVTVVLTTWSGNGQRIRLGKLMVAGPAWLVYCILVRSWSGILCEAIGMSSSAIAVYRYRQKEPNP